MNRRTPLISRTATILIAALLCALLAAFLPGLVTARAGAAESPSADGSSVATAAGSCFEIKQSNPASTSGLYWLWTPSMVGPEQFYCDQETDGGGWVLVGRGREGWSTSDEGMGSVASVREPVTGQAAFAPRQLSVSTISGLMNGGPISDLQEGIRLRRATSTAGSQWQESRFKIVSPRNEWTWVFNADQRVGSWTIGGSKGSGGRTYGFGSGSTQNRIETRVDNGRGWSNGFMFGSGARGTPDAASFIWASSTTAGYPRPFTQIYLRPRVLTSDFPAIPDGGTAARTNPAVPSSRPLPTVWGVTGLGASGVGIQNTEVSAFAEGAGRVYVGGNFAQVQRTASGGGMVAQPYLAAFDVQTGEMISSFRPVLDDQVKALAVLPNGAVAVGGNFLNANGAPAPAFVVLDPETGATDSRYTTKVINYTGGLPPRVRSLDVQGDYLYLGGAFTHLTGGNYPRESYARQVGRIRWDSGTPDTTFNPLLNGTVVSLDASQDGSRLYAAGYFDLGPEAIRAGAFRTDDYGSVIPWHIDFSIPGGHEGRLAYQQAVREVDDRVWLGGSEHMLFSYDRQTLGELSTNITIQGGDFQAINTGGDYILAGCHCSESNYEGADTWPDVGTKWTRQAKISQVGLWNRTTGAYESSFSPLFSMRQGAGAWAIFTDSTGVTWIGGDFTHARRDLISNQWTGGFVRFAPRDDVAPSSPGNLSVHTTGQSDVLQWAASVDERGDSITYQVLRDSRVVATTTSTTADLPAGPPGTRYFVRAADPAGNISASTAVTVTTDTVVPDLKLVDAGGSWSYSFGAAAPAVGWQQASFDDSGWAEGLAPLGWGHSGLGTVLERPSPVPLSSYYRKEVLVEDASKVESVTLTTRADDGVVVYVNGVEVGRANMPEGAVGATTYALSSPSAAAAVAGPVTFQVSGALLTTGANVIAAEVHSGYRGTPSHSFELSALITPGVQPAPEPEPEPEPGPLVDAGGSWSYSFGAAAPAVGWQQASFDDSGWAEGLAPLGWGHSGLGTVLERPTPVPLSSYYRKEVLVEDASKVESVTLTTRADDGVVVYVNGVEVGRANMPEGAVGATTYALSSPSAAAAVAGPVTFQVSGAADHRRERDRCRGALRLPRHPVPQLRADGGRERPMTIGVHRSGSGASGARSLHVGTPPHDDLVGHPAPRDRALPRWPLLTGLYGLPLFWVSGLLPFSYMALAGVMVLLLLVRGRVTFLPGTGPYFAFLLWVAIAVGSIGGVGQLIGYTWRMGDLVAVGIFVLYYANAERLTPGDVMAGLAFMWVVVVALGLAAMVFPEFRLTTPAARLLPGAITGNPLVHELLNPRLAEVQEPWGAAEPYVRPAAPFPYTNSWGTAYVLLTPVVLVRILLTRRRALRVFLVLALLVSALPALATSNRGMFIGLMVVVGYAALRLFLQGRILPLLLVALGSGAVGALLVWSGAVAQILGRQEHSDSTGTRADVYRTTFEETMNSPLVGWGARARWRVEVALGTQGFVWTLMYSYGFVGLALFLVFIGGVVVRTWKVHDMAEIFLHGVVVASCVTILFYGLGTTQLLILVLICAVLLDRRPTGGRHVPH